MNATDGSGILHHELRFPKNLRIVSNITHMYSWGHTNRKPFVTIKR